MGISRRGLMAASAAGPVLMRAQDAMAQGVAPRRGGTLQTILSPEPPVLQIGVNNQGPTLVLAPKIFQGLLTFSPTLEPIPVLAKSWTSRWQGIRLPPAGEREVPRWPADDGR